MIFMVQIQSGPGTRWMCDDADFAAHLKVLAESILEIHTAGTVPKVLISQERPVCEVCDARRTVKPPTPPANRCGCGARVQHSGMSCADCNFAHGSAH